MAPVAYDVTYLESVPNGFYLRDYRDGAPLLNVHGSYADHGPAGERVAHVVWSPTGVPSAFDHDHNGSFLLDQWTRGTRFPADFDACIVGQGAGGREGSFGILMHTRDCGVQSGGNAILTVGQASGGTAFELTMAESPTGTASEAAGGFFPFYLRIPGTSANNPSGDGMLASAPVLPMNQWVWVEVKWRLSTTDETKDGFIEVRVNRIPVADWFLALSDDVSGIQYAPSTTRASMCNLIIPPGTNVTADRYPWDGADIYNVADTAQYYIGAAAIYATDALAERVIPGPSVPADDAPKPSCCENTGPGGTDPDTPFGRTDGFPASDFPTDPDRSPREVVYGGYPPSYTAPTGDGAPADADDPDEPQDLTGATDVVAWTEIDFPNGTTLRVSDDAIIRTSAPIIQPRVSQWNPVSYQLADRSGDFPSQTFGIEASDFDYLFRTLGGASASKHIGYRPIRQFIARESLLWAGTDPLRLANGVITSYGFLPDRQFRIGGTDVFGAPFSATSLDRRVTTRTIRKGLFPNCPEENLERPVPFIYGNLSDAKRWSRESTYTPVGIVPPIYVGQYHSLGGVNFHFPWHFWVVAGHACWNGGVDQVFGSNLSAGTERSVRINPERFNGQDFLIPGQGTGWSTYTSNLYLDITDAQGVTERFTVLAGRGPIADAAVSGSVPLSVNIRCGVESLGNGLGTPIRALARQFSHFLAYVVVNQYKTGLWGSIPADGDGVPYVRTTSFETVKAIHDTRVDGGYEAAWMLKDDHRVRDVMATLQVASDIRLYRNHHGQICASTLHTEANLSGLETFRDELDIEAGSFELDPAPPDAIINVQPYRYGPEPSTGRSAVPEEVRSMLSITTYGYGVREGREMVLAPIQDPDVARDVAARAVLHTEQPLDTGRFRASIRAFHLTPGQLIRVTHEDGIGATGWTDRVLRVTGIEVDPSALSFLVTVRFEDVHKLLLNADDEPAFGFALGDEGASPSTADELGDESNGTAMRLGDVVSVGSP